MSKGIHLAGADDRGDNKYEHAWEREDGQINHTLGEKHAVPDVHCHMYNNPETGKGGVVHRGECGVCKDKDGSNTYSKIGDSKPSENSSSESSDDSGDTGNSGGK